MTRPIGSPPCSANAALRALMLLLEGRPSRPTFRDILDVTCPVSRREGTAEAQANGSIEPF